MAKFERLPEVVDAEVCAHEVMSTGSFKWRIRDVRGSRDWLMRDSRFKKRYRPVTPEAEAEVAHAEELRAALKKKKRARDERVADAAREGRYYDEVGRPTGEGDKDAGGAPD